MFPDSTGKFQNPMLHGIRIEISNCDISYIRLFIFLTIQTNVTTKHMRHMIIEKLLTDERRLPNSGACSNALLLIIQIIKFNQWFIFK